MDCSALSANDHVPSHDAPVLDFDSGSHLVLQVLVIRHRCFECLIVLHIHHLEKISGDGKNYQTFETPMPDDEEDRKSTRLNSSHGYISYAVFCLKKKKK